jgi:ABC-type transporter Mla maintaining outer membrane lipid asymmetry permease subunit MlaE
MYHSFLILASVIGLVGGALGFWVFLDMRRKRYFLEYLNKRLSKKEKEGGKWQR